MVLKCIKGVLLLRNWCFASLSRISSIIDWAAGTSPYCTPFLVRNIRRLLPLNTNLLRRIKNIQVQHPIMRTWVISAIVGLLVAQTIASPVPTDTVHTNGRGGYNSIGTDGRGGYNKRGDVSTAGRSGYNSVDTDGRSGYNKRDGIDTAGRSGYNSIGTDGRSGYN